VEPPHLSREPLKEEAGLLEVQGGQGGHEHAPAHAGEAQGLLPGAVGEEGGHGPKGLHLVEGLLPGVSGQEEGGGEEGPILSPLVLPVDLGARF